MHRPINAEERIAARYIPAGFTVYREVPGGIIYAGKTKTPLKGEMLSAIAYRGTAMKATWNYIFNNETQLNAQCESFFDEIKRHQDFKEERRTKRSNEETDTQKVKKALKEAGYAVTSVRRGLGTAANWIEITINDYDEFIDKDGNRARHYPEVMGIAKLASGRQDLEDDIQTDYFCVNITVNFTKYHRCSECLINNCERYHTPESCICGGFYNQDMADADQRRRENWEAEEKAAKESEQPAEQQPAGIPQPVNRYGYLNVTIEEVPVS